MPTNAKLFHVRSHLHDMWVQFDPVDMHNNCLFHLEYMLLMDDIYFLLNMYQSMYNVCQCKVQYNDNKNYHSMYYNKFHDHYR